MDGWLLVLPTEPPQRLKGERLEVRLVDGVGGSTVEAVDLSSFQPGGRYVVPHPRGFTLGTGWESYETRVVFELTGERDRDGRPVLRLEGSGTPPIRYQPPNR